MLGCYWGKKGTEKEDAKEKPEWVDALEKRLVNVMESQNDIILKRMMDMENKVNERTEALKIEMKKSYGRIKGVEQKTNDIELEFRQGNRILIK